MLHVVELRKLKAAYGEISELLRDTRLFIGGVAGHCFEELNKMPPREGHPVETPCLMDKYSNRTVTVQTTAVPNRNHRKIIGNNSAFRSTSTEIFERYYYPESRNGKPSLRSPIEQDRLVSVVFDTHKKGRNNTLDASITKTGRANRSDSPSWTTPKANSKTSYTETSIYPPSPEPYARGRIGPLDLKVYDNSNQLRVDFTRAYVGALIVTGAVAESLSIAHGIQTHNLRVCPNPQNAPQ